MRVCDILAEAKKPLFTFELVPPLKGGDAQTILETVRTLSQFSPAYINVTNHQEEVVYIERPDGLLERKTVRKRPGTLALSALIQYTFSVPVVTHLICGGSTADQIENDLVELHFLGLENVLALRGDPPAGIKRFVPTSGGHTYSNQLVRQIVDLNAGIYLDPTLKNAQQTNFCIGVAGYPEKHGEAPNLEFDIAMLKKKVECGAHYIVTQMFFDNRVYFRFVEQCREAGITVPIIPGLKPIGSRRDLATIPQTFHVDFPPDLVEQLARASSVAEIREVGVAWCIEQTRELLDAKVPGVHFYTLGKAESVARVVRACY
ncbi:MAG: methylenetetrahydrofolate reductase [Sphaerochaeta sp.]|jgi:methylenetetrahydrofolate reductase (NADPH)|nr:methylenetetrahydrofolate reductase [Sphaerochaeta sp.]MDX9914847.1 methylenetetrahydrofolate reductase [Sphaerochaeta sp.]